VPVTTSKITRAVWFLAVAVAVASADQVIKNAVIASLQPGIPQDFIGGLVRLVLVYNDSAAFSIGFGQTWFFAILSAVAALALLWFGPRVRSIGWAVIAGLALGGITGNLIDRLTRAPGFGSGLVVDYIQIPFNFPIFNLADSAICVSAAIVIIQIARGRKLGG
jgi:signal peptidase II